MYVYNVMKGGVNMYGVKYVCRYVWRGGGMYCMYGVGYIYRYVCNVLERQTNQTQNNPFFSVIILKETWK